MDEIMILLEEIKELNSEFQANPNHITFRKLNEELKKLQYYSNQWNTEKMIQ